MSRPRYDDEAFDRHMAQHRRKTVDLLHQRRCPHCEQRMLQPFQFPSGTWGFQCAICGAAAMVAELATRGWEVWRPQDRSSTYKVDCNID